MSTFRYYAEIDLDAFEPVSYTHLDVYKRQGADRVFEAAGGSHTFELAWKIARPNAIVTIVALYEENQTLPLPQMYGKNLTLDRKSVV